MDGVKFYMALDDMCSNSYSDMVCVAVVRKSTVIIHLYGEGLPIPNTYHCYIEPASIGYKIEQVKRSGLKEEWVEDLIYSLLEIKDFHETT